MIHHTSVMKEEVLSYLAPGEGECLLIDGTLGEGGHSEAFLNRFENLRVIGLDADPRIQEKAKRRLRGFGGRFKAVNTWFDTYLEDYHGEAPQRILIDLGISLYHYREGDRGFSFQEESSLDMRLNPESPETPRSAADLVNNLPADALADIIYQYGEERFSRRIARAVERRRRETPFADAADLAEVVRQAVPGSQRHGRMNPATKTFQALRIAVNRELERLDRVLPAALKALAVGGRLGIITFHSLEDRRVKQFFQFQAKSCICPPEVPRCVCGAQPAVKRLTKKPVMAAEEEIQANPPSRSAKFRVAEKIADLRVPV